MYVCYVHMVVFYFSASNFISPFHLYLGTCEPAVVVAPLDGMAENDCLE